MATIQVTARVDENIKNEAQKVFERQGLDIASVIKMLLTKTAFEQSIPLTITEQVQTSALPSDWFSPERVENRKSITELAFEKSPVKFLDLSKAEDREEFLNG